jgi:NADP-dependent 3-hydroxy acid dehydrogenase YdfG
MGKLDGKVAIVRGGGSGIGKGIARGLALEGAKTIIAARGVNRLSQAAEELTTLGTTVVPQPTDVTNEAQVSALFARAMDLSRRVDILVNNAGAADGGPLDELSVET